MFYNYNNLTGRITTSSNLQSPLFPISPLPYNRPIPNVTYDSSVKIANVTQVRGQSQKTIPGTNLKYAPLDEKLRKKMELFQKPNDIPVFLKGGPSDMILYRLTMGLCIVGVLWSWSFFYSRAYKKG